MTLSLLALAAAQTFAAGTPAFDPRRHKNEIAGSPAQVFVLGTPHLSQLPNKLDPALLEPLLASLARFHPDVIAIEGVSGEECDTLLRFKAAHGDAWKDYCWPTEDIEKATGLSVPAATDEIDRVLASWPKDPSPAQRRRLAMLFLAANDRASAMVQWLRVPAGERHAGDGITPQMVDILERKGKPINENYAIGAALASRLGLERVYSVDDHVADGQDQGPAYGKAIQAADGQDQGPAYGKAIQAAWNAKPTPAILAQYKRGEANLRTPEALMAYYRWINEPTTQRAAIAADMGRAARDPSPEHYGRQYLSWWENRNLRIAANIRTAFEDRPDARVLVIIGSTHKGYLDAYLDMMQDVRIVDAMQFLR